jgi:hypothetical protein
VRPAVSSGLEATLSTRPRCLPTASSPSPGAARVDARLFGRGHGRLALATAVAVVALGAVACDKVDEDRAQSEAVAKAHAAIAAYSEAAQAANGLHGEVIDAFQRANRSSSLPDYRDAIRKEVLPAMDRFIERLRAMPTGTPDLDRIHGGLVKAYSEARDQLASYADNLNAAANLSEFQPIREQLRQRVAAYRGDLEAYYRGQNRQLRNEPAAPAAEATRTAP